VSSYRDAKKWDVGQADSNSNGTSDLCLPAALNTSDTADSNSFFSSLITGTGLDGYMDNVFKQAQCTGCIYEVSDKRVQYQYMR
jgi:hypothetical protein